MPSNQTPFVRRTRRVRRSPGQWWRADSERTPVTSNRRHRAASIPRNDEENNSSSDDNYVPESFRRMENNQFTNNTPVVLFSDSDESAAIRWSTPRNDDSNIGAKKRKSASKLSKQKQGKRLSTENTPHSHTPSPQIRKAFNFSSCNSPPDLPSSSFVVSRPPSPPHVDEAEMLSSPYPPHTASVPTSSRSDCGSADSSDSNDSSSRRDGVDSSSNSASASGLERSSSSQSSSESAQSSASQQGSDAGHSAENNPVGAVDKLVGELETSNDEKSFYISAPLNTSYIPPGHGNANINTVNEEDGQIIFKPSSSTGVKPTRPSHTQESTDASKEIDTKCKPDEKPKSHPMSSTPKRALNILPEETGGPEAYQTGNESEDIDEKDTDHVGSLVNSNEERSEIPFPSPPSPRKRVRLGSPQTPTPNKSGYKAPNDPGQLRHEVASRKALSPPSAPRKTPKRIRNANPNLSGNSNSFYAQQQTSHEVDVDWPLEPGIFQSPVRYDTAANTEDSTERNVSPLQGHSRVATQIPMPGRPPFQVIRSSSLHFLHARDNKHHSSEPALSRTPVSSAIAVPMSYACVCEISLNAHSHSGVRRVKGSEETFFVSRDFNGLLYGDVRECTHCLRKGDYVVVEPGESIEFYNASFSECRIILIQAR